MVNHHSGGSSVQGMSIQTYRQMSVIEQVPATQGYLLREMPLFNEMVCRTMRLL